MNLQPSNHQLHTLPPDIIYTLLTLLPDFNTLSTLLATQPTFAQIYTNFHRTILRHIIKTRYHPDIWDLIAVALTLHEIPPYPHATVDDVACKSHWPSRHDTHSFIDDNELFVLERPVETVRRFARTEAEVDKLTDLYFGLALGRLKRVQDTLSAEARGFRFSSRSKGWLLRAMQPLETASVTERMRVEMPLWAFYVFKKHDEVFRLEGVKWRCDSSRAWDPSAEKMIVDLLGKQNQYQVRTVEMLVNSFRLERGPDIGPERVTAFPEVSEIAVGDVSWFVRYLRVREEGTEIHVPLRSALYSPGPVEDAKGLSDEFASDLWTRYHEKFHLAFRSDFVPQMRPKYFALCTWDSARLERLFGDDVEAWEGFPFPEMRYCTSMLR